MTNFKTKNLLFFGIFYCLMLYISVERSVDYDVYLRIFAQHEYVDLFFYILSIIGENIQLSPEFLYAIYLFALAFLITYYCITRNISFYWISVYMLVFFTLHVVTQVRQCAAIFIMAISYTGNKRILSLIGPLFHSSSFLLLAINWGRTKSTVFMLSFFQSLAFILIAKFFSKVDRYSEELNQASQLSYSFLTLFCVIVFVVLCPVKKLEKFKLINLGGWSIVLYFYFLDYNVVSNRIIELTCAFIILILPVEMRGSAWNNLLSKNISYIFLFLVSVSNFFFFNFYNQVLKPN